MRRILSGVDLWVTEFVLTNDGQPSYVVSIMEFRDGKVAHETQYSAMRSSPARRARMGGAHRVTRGKE